MTKNTPRNTVLGEAVEVADTSEKRRVGLLKHARLDSGSGLWIVPCESVHTFFMKFPIDLVYLDKHRKVRKVRHAVPPWRLSACLTAHSILELPAGTVEKSGTLRGDELLIEKLNAWNPATYPRSWLLAPRSRFPAFIRPKSPGPTPQPPLPSATGTGRCATPSTPETGITHCAPCARRSPPNPITSPCDWNSPRPMASAGITKSLSKSAASRWPDSPNPARRNSPWCATCATSTAGARPLPPWRVFSKLTPKAAPNSIPGWAFCATNPASGRSANQPTAKPSNWLPPSTTCTTTWATTY